MAASNKAAATALTKGALRTSKRLIFSYVLDWIFIIGIAAVGAGFNRIDRSSHRAFALQDPSISYPNLPDTVTVTTLICVALAAPAGLTLLISLLLVPGSAGAPPGTSRALIWRRKLWEWNTAWMGLGLSLAAAFVVTEGLKDLAGKPRPHAIAVCRPDLDRIAEFQVGGLGQSLGPAIPILVDYRICQETDVKVLRDAFASWPSGHSSFSFAGLLYLSFFLAAKLNVGLPFLNPISETKKRQIKTTFDAYELDGRRQESDHDTDQVHESARTSIHPPRNQAAAPPVYLLVLVFVPIGTALFICVSRWFDYHHHGFDVISGALIGIFTSWFSFRFYHLPIRRGAGWSWGARSRDRALWLGVGNDTYVGEEGWEAAKSSRSKELRDSVDLESQEVTSAGVEGHNEGSARVQTNGVH